MSLRHASVGTFEVTCDGGCNANLRAGRAGGYRPSRAEWDYGDYEGQRSPDIAKQRPGWNIFVDGGLNGESPQDVSARADRLISRLEAMDGNVALFSHGHFSRVLTARWLGFPLVAGQRFMLDTGTLSNLRDDPRHPELRVIALWNALPEV